MSVAVLIGELRRRGVTLEARGDRLRFRPASAVPPDLIATLRAQKTAILAALCQPARAGTERAEVVAGPNPFAELQRDWQVAVARARENFAAQGVEPSERTLDAAAWIELLLSAGWDGRWGWSEVDARNALAAIYGGRRIALVGEDARVLLSLPLGQEPAAEVID